MGQTKALHDLAEMLVVIARWFQGLKIFIQKAKTNKQQPKLTNGWFTRLLSCVGTG
jgi:hypothetical protein